MIAYRALIITIFISQIEGGDYGILKAHNETNELNFCVVYYPEIYSLPQQINNYSHMLPLVDQDHWDGCSNPQNPQTFNQNFVIITNNDTSCSISERSHFVQNNTGSGLLLYSKNGVVPKESKIEHQSFIPVAAFGPKTFSKLKAMGFNTTVISMFSPPTTFDFSLLIIFAMAMSSITIGAYWSGVVRHELNSAEDHKPSEPEGTEPDTAGDDVTDKPTAPIIKEETSLNVSPKLIIVIVILMCSLLLLLYYFYSYLVWLIITMYCIASTTAFYHCSYVFVSKIPCGTSRLCQIQSKYLTCAWEIRQILLCIVSLTLPIVWVINRKEDWSWMLQDLLGICFSIYILRTLRLPNFMICTCLLVALFFYDIFFVFITPYITENGESVMVEVATGGSGSGGGGATSGGGGGKYVETLPMVLKVPHIGKDSLVSEVCNLGVDYSLLGFGDILVPGLLVSYCHAFDLLTGTPRRLYFIVEVTAYGVGLLITFLALKLMQVAQPALLYLVPCTLLPPILISLCRNEFRALWTGTIQLGNLRNDDPPTPTENSDVTPNGTNYNTISVTEPSDTPSNGIQT